MSCRALGKLRDDFSLVTSFMTKTLLAISTVFVLLPAVSLAALASLGVTRGVAVTASQNTKDVTIVTRPLFRNERKHEIELADQSGRLVAEQRYTYLDFKYQGKIYSAWWKSRTTPAPVGLFANVRYRFIIRLSGANTRCEVIKIWLGKKLIWSNPKFEQGMSRELLKNDSAQLSSSAYSSGRGRTRLW